MFPIIESYLLLGAAAALTPLSQAIQVSLEKAVLAVTQAVVESMRGTSQAGQQSQPQVSGSGLALLSKALLTACAHAPFPPPPLASRRASKSNTGRPQASSACTMAATAAHGLLMHILLVPLLTIDSPSGLQVEYCTASHLLSRLWPAHVHPLNAAFLFPLTPLSQFSFSPGLQVEYRAAAHLVSRHCCGGSRHPHAIT